MTAGLDWARARVWRACLGTVTSAARAKARSAREHRNAADEEDVRALKRARAAGHSASDLVRKGLRVVASRYYTGRRPPSTRLFESTDTKLGDESELFRDLED